MRNRMRSPSPVPVPVPGPGVGVGASVGVGGNFVATGYSAQYRDTSIAYTPSPSPSPRGDSRSRESSISRLPASGARPNCVQLIPNLSLDQLHKLCHELRRERSYHLVCMEQIRDTAERYTREIQDCESVPDTQNIPFPHAIPPLCGLCSAEAAQLELITFDLYERIQESERGHQETGEAQEGFDIDGETVMLK